jgi:hypothetical protein
MFSADGRKGTPPAAARGLAHVARGARALEAVARVANALLLREVASALTKRDSESEMRLVCVIRCAAGARSLVRGKRRGLRRSLAACHVCAVATCTAMRHLPRRLVALARTARDFERRGGRERKAASEGQWPTRYRHTALRK